MSDVTLENIKDLIAASIKESLPVVIEAVKAAVAVQQAIDAPAKPEPRAVDRVDALVLAHTGALPDKDAVLAPNDPESRVNALEQHVAALTVATAHASSARLSDIKNAISAQAKAAQEVAHAVDSARA